MLDREDAEAQALASANAAASASAADAAAELSVAIEAWKVKTRKACHVKPDAELTPLTVRELTKTCQALVDIGLKVQGSGEYPELPDATETAGMMSVDGCRAYIDSYVDAKNAFGVKVRTKYRCTYDPTVGFPSYKVLP